MARKRRSFTAEFKDEAVKLVLERGLTISQAAVDLDLNESTLGAELAAVTAIFTGKSSTKQVESDAGSSR